MQLEIISIDGLQFEKVAFYTVQKVGHPSSEFADFMNRMKQDPKDWKQAGELNRFIENIGRLYGATDQWFKREGNAERLPPPTYRFVDSDGDADFGLRLYCIVLSEEVVILLNGDRKTAQKIKDCPNCYQHFLLANEVSDAIYQAKIDDQLEVSGKDILTEEDFIITIPDKSF